VIVPAIIRYLQAQRYDGWYTLEQDAIFVEKPRDRGPVEDVAASADYLRSVLRRTG
jgi:inosose dehydratase